MCPMCGGRLKSGITTIPFVLDETILVMKDVPAEICEDCYEPFLIGHITDQVMALLKRNNNGFRNEQITFPPIS